VRLAIVLLAALAFAAAAAAGGSVTASSIETELVCPVCHETLDQSNAPVAQEMKREIRRRIAEGWTRKQIIDEMVANFGPGVLSTPSKHGFDLLAWLLPVAGVLVGAAALGVTAWHWSARRGRAAADKPALEPELSPEDERLVDRELARFE